MKNAILLLRENRELMSGTEREIADFILENAKTVAEMNIKELSRQTFASTSTIYRMCCKMGFRGYKEFSKSLIYETAVQNQYKKIGEKEIRKSDSIEDIIEKVTYKNIVSIEDTKNLIEAGVLARCVELIVQSRTVLLFGIGASFCAAKDTYLKFLRMNKPCVINEDWHSQLLQARNSQPDDVGIVFSYSGETVEILSCMKAMRENHTPVIAITRFVKSPVTELATHKLYIAANESTFRSGAMASRISQLNVVDILYMAYAHSQYDYSLKQLSRTHIKKNDTIVVKGKSSRKKKKEPVPGSAAAPKECTPNRDSAGEIK